MPGTKAGGPVRSIFSLVSLIKNHFDIYIFTSNCDLGNNEEYKDVKPDTLFENEGVNYYYFSKNNLNVDSILEQVNKINPSLIYLNSFWSYNFSIGIVKAKNSGLISAPILLAPRGMLGKGAMGLKSFKKIVFITLAQIFNSYSKITFHATNRQEEKDILKRFKNAKIQTASNLNSGIALSIHKVKEEKKLKLFYLSRIARIKNLHFALEVLKDIPEEISIEYDIYGNNEDKEYWDECKSIIQSLPENIKVNYKGELQFNRVQETIAAYHALFLPTLNENFGHSIVESFLSGCLVVISDQTPWTNLEKEKIGFALPLENKKNFVNALIDMAKLNNADYALKSKQAISYISHKLNIQKNIEEYKNLFNGTIKN